MLYAFSYKHTLYITTPTGFAVTVPIERFYCMRGGTTVAGFECNM